MPPGGRLWHWDGLENLQAGLILFRFVTRHNRREHEIRRSRQSWKHGVAPLAADKAFRWSKLLTSLLLRDKLSPALIRSLPSCAGGNPVRINEDLILEWAPP
jgi:hypothetical protein